MVSLSICLAFGAGAAALSPAEAAAAKPLAKQVRGIAKQVAKSKKSLGKTQTRRLTAHLRRASSAVRRRDTCGAIKALGRFVDATKRTKPRSRPAAAKLAAQARRSQAKLGRRARGRRACGKLRVRRSGAVRPSVASIPGIAGGKPRAVTAVKGKRSTTSFVEQELVVSVKSRAQLAGFLRRTGGKVIAAEAANASKTRFGNVYLVKIPTGKGAARAAKKLPDILRTIDPRARGSLRVADTTGLRTLGVAAREAARGVHVGVNQIFEPHAGVKPEDLAAFPGQKFLDSATADESVGTPAKPVDVFQSQHMDGVWKFGVGRAWQDLEITGKLKPNSVDVAVVDGGYLETPELPGSTYTSTAYNSSSKRHGYAVSQTIAGRPDNKRGFAGVGGPVARVRGIEYSFDGFSVMARTYDAIDTGAPIINMSIGSEMDAAISFFNIPFEDATQEAAAQNRLVIVSAGNDGRDVDAEDCFFVCWEEEWIAPCENDGVLCVGGLYVDEQSPTTIRVARDLGSNYGFESCNSYDCSVKLFAPYTVRLLTDEGKGLRFADGTSFSSPFVAGAAALMLAADPKLSAGQLRYGLLNTASEFEGPQSGSLLEVPRWVNVHGAVSSVLKDTNPLIGVFPATGGTYSPNAKVELRAIALVQEGQGGCCSYSWRSDRDGFLGSGQTIAAGFSNGPGKRTITVTAKTTAGFKSEKSFPLTLGGNQPVPKITKPAAGATLYRGVEYEFEGSWQDIDHGFADGNCNALKWTVARGFGTPTTLTGCEPTITFGVNGQKTITLEATDPDGNKATTAPRTITVTDAPLNAPPVAEIVSPNNGQTLLANTTYLLKGKATDPDGTGPLTYQWTVEGNSFVGEKLISTALQTNWTPHDHVPSSCGGDNVILRFKATDPNGTTVAATNHFVTFGPC